MHMNKQKYVLLTPILDVLFDKSRPPPDLSPYLLFYINSLLLWSVKNTGAKVLSYCRHDNTYF